MQLFDKMGTWYNVGGEAAEAGRRAGLLVPDTIQVHEGAVLHPLTEPQVFKDSATGEVWHMYHGKTICTSATIWIKVNPTGTTG